ncbi:hypothetical protein [Candidatus Weimeria sp. HCP3S3_B5]|uniref:hypothetical protein n=1 Tax=Candidatus Weimeria sp. HCP3S3_B5 TaxID=3438871 RepID=UPI003F8ABC21
MGELILCRQPMAATPFYIENASLNIYSLEELCYYIYHNTETLDPMLISDELLDWIDQELSFTALSERLRTQKRSGMPFHVQIETILSSCGYLTPAEIRDTVHDIMLFMELSPEEKKKRIADQLLKKGRIRRAILNYQEILKIPGISRGFYGDVCHNIGYAYARAFLFREASEYYRMAYERNTSSKSLSQMLFCLMETGDEKAIDKAVEDFHIRPDQIEMARKVFKAASESDQVKKAQDEALKKENVFYGLREDYIRKYGA